MARPRTPAHKLVHPKRTKKNAKHPAKHLVLTDFYTAEQERQMESEKLEAQMFEHLKKLRKPGR